MFPLFLLFLAIIVTTLKITYSKKPLNTQQKFATLLKFIIFFNIGVMGLLGYYVHTFMPDEIAKGIGWAPGSPFQFEVAMANLAFGILGVLSLFFGPQFWLATVLGQIIYFIGCFWGHMVQLSLGNTAPYNAGIYIWLSDLILPIAYGFLMIYYYILYRKNRTENY